MAHWKWEPSFSVGIVEIDNQHKQLIQYINDLNIAFAYNKRYMTEEVLKKLVQYTISHFAFEENLMEEAGYPVLEPHKKLHESFVNRIIFFQERYENGENISKQLQEELQLWLINHIKNDDKNYKDIVKQMLREKSQHENEDTKHNWISSLINKYFI